MHELAVLRATATPFSLYYVHCLRCSKYRNQIFYMQKTSLKNLGRISDYHKIGKSILKVVISVIRVSMHLKIYDMRESVSDVFVIQCTSIYKKKIFLDCPGSITYGGLFRRPPDSILGERIPHLNCMTKDSLDPYRMFSLSSLF